MNKTLALVIVAVLYFGGHVVFAANMPEKAVEAPKTSVVKVFEPGTVPLQPAMAVDELQPAVGGM